MLSAASPIKKISPTYNLYSNFSLVHWTFSSLVAWKYLSSYMLSSQELVLSSKCGQYFEKIKLFLLSKSAYKHSESDFPAYGLSKILFSFFPCFLAISLLINIATEGWTENEKEAEQLVLLFINNLSTKEELLAENI